MKILYQSIVFALVILTTHKSYPNDEPVYFTDKNQEQRYYLLIEEN